MAICNGISVEVMIKTAQKLNIQVMNVITFILTIGEGISSSNIRKCISNFEPSFNGIQTAYRIPSIHRYVSITIYDLMYKSIDYIHG